MSQQVLFYELGYEHGTVSWPYEISFAPFYRSGEFYLAEGDGRNGSGGFFQPGTMLESQWYRHLEITGSLWLIPLLENMTGGNMVTTEDILQAYYDEKGHPATCCERTLYE